MSDNKFNWFISIVVSIELTVFFTSLLYIAGISSDMYIPMSIIMLVVITLFIRLIIWLTEGLIRGQEKGEEICK